MRALLPLDSNTPQELTPGGGVGALGVGASPLLGITPGSSSIPAAREALAALARDASSLMHQLAPAEARKVRCGAVRLVSACLPACVHAHVFL
jgi:hypothetical protein